MRWLTAALRSSVGKKFVMGVTGLFLCLFLVVHLAGNLLLFAGPEAYNEYAHQLHAMPVFLVTAEVFLFAAFAAHIYLGVVTTRENRAARPVGYETKQSKKEPGTIVSAISPENTMWFTGAAIFLYLLLHLADFKLEATGAATVEEPFEKARLLMSEFWRVVAYAVASILVGYHVSHGFSSAFQSLGLDHPKYTPWIKTISLVFAFVVGGGFLLVSFAVVAKGWVLFGGQP